MRATLPLRRLQQQVSAARALAYPLAGTRLEHRFVLPRWQASRLMSSSKADDLEQAVSEQHQVLFPRLQQLEEAQLVQDEKVRRAVSSVPSEEWSPQAVPYQTFERDTGVDDSDDDSDEEDLDSEEDHVPSVLVAEAEDAEGIEDPDMGGLDDNTSEVGFRYQGPEPTQYGDWHHKGRCSDF
mmetsp:Transcript_56680/g.104942  ORF Transcript_56680/g.104942 Transcript_56680/m.104942 type:complete len:182 (+) Transcript_56680:66-611(+)